MEGYFRNPVENYNEKVLSFQALEWQDFNEEKNINKSEDEMSVDLDTDENQEDKLNEKYIIRVFGVDKNKNSICLNINDFTPFFYIKVSDSWKKHTTQALLEKLSLQLSKTKQKNGNNWINIDYSKNLLKNKCILQSKFDFYGFSNNKSFNFLRLTFNNSDAMKKCISIVKNHNNSKKRLSGFSNIPLYESNLDPIIRFSHIKNLNFCGWLQCDDFIVEEKNNKISSCQVECSVNWQKVESLKDNTNAPILQASYDIETYSHDGKFPSPNVKENVITQIATSFKFFGSDKFYFKHIVCLKKCSPLEQDDDVPVFMEWYETEKEVLLAWKRLIIKTDPDILYQYNGDQFDGNYIYTRVTFLNLQDEYVLGKIKNTPSYIKDSNFSSSAYGNTSFKRLILHGRINFDILIYIKREYNENSYKLDYISEKYLGENKNPVTPAMMFKYFKEGDPDKIKEVAYYCIKDTLLPQKLVDKMHILQNQISMSNVTQVPIRFLIERGQQIKVFSQILKETRQHNYLVPTIDNYGIKDENSEFTGATVLPPLKGAYFEPITVCDFASLYPSIIRAHNLCFSTIVLDEKFDNLKDVEYLPIEWEDKEENGKITKHKFKFVQNKQGILPKLLTELTESRKEYKRLMKNVGNSDPFLKEVYNKCQLAVKVSMNSIYGFLAAPMLCCKPIAACVTAIGRDMISSTKSYMENEYQASTAVYGDSVTGDTPVLVRHKISKNIEILPIKDIPSQSFINWTPYNEFKPHEITNRKNKMQIFTNYQTWTDKGWSDIKRVIKHSTTKNIFTVLSNFGCVDVTEDHSLLSKDIELLKPLECFPGTPLLYSIPKEEKDIGNTVNQDKNKTYMMGLIDTFDLYNEKNLQIDKIFNADLDSKKSYLEGLAKNKKIIITDIVDDKEILVGFKCYNKLFCSKLYYIMSLVYENKIIVNTEYTGDTNEHIIYFLYFHYNNDEKKENNVNRVCLSNLNPEENCYSTVYDLETDLGRFQAGIGQTIIKNTDSVFIKFKTKTTEKYKKAIDNPHEFSKEEIKDLKTECIRESIEMGKIAGKNATKDLFKNPINLEYEKVYCPLLLLSKKRYIGDLYSEDPSRLDKMDNKGIVLKRRDNFDILKKTYKRMIDIIMEEGKSGINKVIEYVQDTLYKIINNQFEDINDFIISKSLKDDYKSKNIPHLVLANKLRERDPGTAPKSNDRVPYVFTNPDIRSEVGRKWIEDIDQKRKKDFIEKVSELSSKHIKSFEEAKETNKKLSKKVVLKKGKLNQYEKVEDPEYLVKNNLPLDAEYYITFMKIPMTEILSLFTDDAEKIFNDIITEYHNSNW